MKIIHRITVFSAAVLSVFSSLARAFAKAVFYFALIVERSMTRYIRQEKLGQGSRSTVYRV
jgi:hypothetical protein